MPVCCFLIYLLAPFIRIFSLVARMSLSWSFGVIFPAYIPFLGVGGCVRATIYRKVRVRPEILGSVCQCMCRSYASYSY
jgi:hypothetical protein